MPSNAVSIWWLHGQICHPFSGNTEHPSAFTESGQLPVEFLLYNLILYQKNIPAFQLFTTERQGYSSMNISSMATATVFILATVMLSAGMLVCMMAAAYFRIIIQVSAYETEYRFICIPAYAAEQVLPGLRRRYRRKSVPQRLHSSGRKPVLHDPVHSYRQLGSV